MKTMEEIHEFWKNPNGINLPETYILGDRSLFILDLFKNTDIKLTDSILELGCSVGRNLNFLFMNGYKNLTGIEININAKPVMKKTFPLLYKYVKIYWNSIEDTPLPQIDVIYTMAVLEHIHPDSEWIFEEMSHQVNKYIITIEDERIISDRHFVRNYKNVFENLGLTQIYEKNCTGVYELGGDFYARIFKK